MVMVVMVVTVAVVAKEESYEAFALVYSLVY